MANAHLVNYKSMISIRFRREPVYNYLDAKNASSDKLYAKLFHHLLHHGHLFTTGRSGIFFCFR